MDRTALPQTIMGYVVRSSGRHQLALALLAAAVFGLSTVPLYLNNRASTIYAGSNEIQRNIIAKAILAL